MLAPQILNTRFISWVTYLLAFLTLPAKAGWSLGLACRAGVLWASPLFLLFWQRFLVFSSGSCNHLSAALAAAVHGSLDYQRWHGSPPSSWELGDKGVRSEQEPWSFLTPHPNSVTKNWVRGREEGVQPALTYLLGFRHLGVSLPLSVHSLGFIKPWFRAGFLFNFLYQLWAVHLLSLVPARPRPTPGFFYTVSKSAFHRYLCQMIFNLMEINQAEETQRCI